MPTNVLVSGAPERIAAVVGGAARPRLHGRRGRRPGRRPAACTEAGENAFDAYLQLPASFAIEGRTALERLHHFYVKGVLARFPAMNAAVPALKPGGRITVVAWPLPAEVATDDDIEARRALYRVLAHGAQADAGDDLVVRVLGSSTSPEDIVLGALGKESVAAGGGRVAVGGVVRRLAGRAAGPGVGRVLSHDPGRAAVEGGRGGRQRDRGRDRRRGRAHGQRPDPAGGRRPVDDPARAADAGDGRADAHRRPARLAGPVAAVPARPAPDGRGGRGCRRPPVAVRARRVRACPRSPACRPSPGCPATPATMSARQLQAVVDDIAARRSQVQALVAQLKVFDEQLATLETSLRRCCSGCARGPTSRAR